MKKLLLCLLLLPSLGFGQSLYEYQNLSKYRVRVGELFINNEKIHPASSDSGQILQYNGERWINATKNAESDPIYSADSTNLKRPIRAFERDSENYVWWKDTIPTSGAGIASRYDNSLKQNLLVNSAGLAGALSDETGSVGGGLSVFNKSPIFNTDLTTPLIIGGTAEGSNITYKSTTGMGTSSIIAHKWLGGTNGGTVLGTVLNNGNWGIGTDAPLDRLQIYNGNIRMSNQIDGFNRLFVECFPPKDLPMTFLNAVNRDLDNRSEVQFGGGTVAGYAANIISFYTANDRTTTTGTLAMRIYQGKVGINTSSPSARLHVREFTTNSYVAIFQNDKNSTADSSVAITPTGQIIKGIEQAKVPGVLFTQTANKTISNTINETTLIGTGVGSTSLPALSLIAGKTVRMTIAGYLSCDANDSTTVTIKVGSTTLVTSKVKIPVSMTNIEFKAQFTFTCRTTGSSGTVIGQGETTLFEGQAFTTTYPRALQMTSTATVNTTVINALDATYKFNAARATNSITVTNLIIEILN